MYHAQVEVCPDEGTPLAACHRLVADALDAGLSARIVKVGPYDEVEVRSPTVEKLMEFLSGDAYAAGTVTDVLVEGPAGEVWYQTNVPVVGVPRL